MARGKAEERGGAAPGWLRALPPALVLATVAVYAQVAGHGFLIYDDPRIITENPPVLEGLSLENLVWAFTTFHMYNWEPLTWISHMLDTDLFGMEPGPRHLVGVALHALAAVLLHLFLARATGAPVRSFFVAALFALHPLNAQPVAWLASRKDQLAGLFFALGLLAYARHAERPSPARYGALLAAFAGGLLAKPVLVTFPFLLLLLDYWPLRRFRPEAGAGVPAGRLLLEKLPLLALSVGVSAVTVVGQVSEGALRSGDDFPLPLRLANAVVTLATVLRRVLWPADLAIHYPYPLELLDSPGSRLAVAACALALLVATAAALHFGRRLRYLPVGWLWFVGMFVPMLGLVQVGRSATADRYAYLPVIGLFVLLVWGVADLAAVRRRLPLAAALGGVALAACAVATARELRHWRDSDAVFARALAVTEENEVAHFQLGRVRSEAGDAEAAARHYREAVRIRPDYWKAWTNLGRALLAAGDADGSLAAFREALRLAPGVSDVDYNFGLALVQLGRPDEAQAHFAAVLEREPGHVSARLELGNTLLLLGEPERARPHFELVLAARPASFEARFGLANALVFGGEAGRAVPHFEELTRARPGSFEAWYGLGHSRSRSGDLAGALEGYGRAERLRPDDAVLLNDLGAAELEAGRIEQGLRHLERAVRLAPGEPFLRFNYARALAASGRTGEAVAQLEALLRRAPDDGEARALLESLRGRG